MKKTVTAFFVFFALPLAVFADDFTDAIQDLAIQTACIGMYSSTQAGGGWYDDPYDYYTPQMMAQRFANMSGNKTRTETFYGVCFDYAQFAYNDIKTYKKWYNDRGMHEGQYVIAGVHSNSNQITLQWPKESSNTLQNGIPVEKENRTRNVKTHRLGNGERATDHAWLWIMRDDGVWFWIDPTWTDNVGYVVWGYVANGEEIQLKPDPYYCINYPAYLNDLPDPPARGPVIQPRPSPSPSPSTQVAQGTSSSSSSSRSSSSGSTSMNNTIFSMGLSVPTSGLFGDYGVNIGCSASFETGEGPWFLILQGDWYIFEPGSILANVAIGKQFANKFGIYAGGGLGTVSSSNILVDFMNDLIALDFDSFHLAWKAFGGVRLLAGHLSIRADISYVRDTGFILGLHAGRMF